MISREAPQSLEELARIMRRSAVGGEVLAVEGGRTKHAWLRAGPAADVVLGTTRLRGIREHARGDLTVTVRAGMRLVELQRELARERQRLAVDPPVGPQAVATVGGVFATDDAGPARLAFGSLRELCIGATVVLPDGSVARSGGRVIKNVAGYDLCKLYCGSRGTLGVAAELTFRLHPLPPEELTVRFAVPSEEAAELALRLRTGRLAPTGVTVAGDELWVRFEGAEGSVRKQRALTEEILDGRPGRELEGAESRAAWAALTEARRAGEGEVELALSCLPSRVGALIAGLPRVLEGGDPTRVTSDPLLGATYVRLPSAPLAAQARALEAARAAALAAGGHARARARPAGLDGLVDPFGPLPPAIEVMRAVKQRLDPVGRCMPGRYLPRV